MKWVTYVQIVKCIYFKNEFAPLSLAHKELQFPEFLPELLGELNRLEERILAPRISFI